MPARQTTKPGLQASIPFFIFSSKANGTKIAAALKPNPSNNHILSDVLNSLSTQTLERDCNRIVTPIHIVRNLGRGSERCKSKSPENQTIDQSICDPTSRSRARLFSKVTLSWQDPSSTLFDVVNGSAMGRLEEYSFC